MAENISIWRKRWLGRTTSGGPPEYARHCHCGRIVPNDSAINGSAVSAMRDPQDGKRFPVGRRSYSGDSTFADLGRSFANA